jgi:hypothetical protein
MPVQTPATTCANPCHYLCKPLPLRINTLIRKRIICIFAHYTKTKSMQNKNTPADLSCFRLSLLAFLNESHPHLANDEKFISARVETALDAYEQAVKNGNNPFEATQIANEVLFFCLHFSKHDTLKTILWNEFANEVPEEKASEVAIRLLPECESIFVTYSLSDDFAYSPEYDMLYTELTGAIALYLENYGIQQESTFEDEY